MSLRLAVGVALFTTGAAAMVYEVVLLRELAIVLGATEAAASLVLASFMAGLAIGGRLFGGVSERSKDPLGLLVCMELAIAACALYLLPLARALPALHDWTLELAAAALAVLPPTVLMGGELPIATRLLALEDARKGLPARTGEHVGYAYSADTLGGIAGAAATGLALVPALGALKAMLFGALLNVGSALVLRSRHRLPPGRLPVVALLPLALLALAGLSALDVRSLELGLVDRIYEYRVLYTEQTPYQRIDVVNHTSFGKALFLNGQLQLTVGDEAIYHEALVHPALVAHPSPRRVLVIGGGDGGALREVLKHGPDEVTLVELDPRVVSVSRVLLPEVGRGAFDDPRVSVVYDDGRRFLREAVEAGRRWDAIVLDLSDPTTSGVAMLYTREAYGLARAALDEGGVLVAQATSPYWYPRAYASVVRTLEAAGFWVVRPMVVWVPTFGQWGYAFASMGPDPEAMTRGEVAARLAERGVNTTYYTARSHAGMFILTGDVERALADPAIQASTDDSPYILSAMQEEEDE